MSARPMVQSSGSIEYVGKTIGFRPGTHFGTCMTDEAAAQPVPQSALVRTLRGIGPRQVRLASGVVLFVYIVSHFANHALGNVSLEAMGNMLQYQIVFWRSWPATVVLYAAALAHTALGIWALYERRHFRWTAAE